MKRWSVFAALAAAGAGCAWPAWASNIPFRPEAAEGPSGGQWGLAVGVCIAVLAALVYLARRGWLTRLSTALPKSGMPSGGDLKVIDTLRLGPQSRLVTVAFGEQVLLLSVTPQATTVLSTRKADPT